MAETLQTQIQELQNAMQTLEQQRAILGDAVAEQAIAALRAQLAALQIKPQPATLAAQASAAQGQLEGERKPVTILFTDIVGSTTHAEKLDPEDWLEIVNGAHARVMHAVAQYDGTIAQLLGDGVLAFFGAPVTHEDDPVRAVRAALEIQTAMQSYAQALRARLENFRMRVGVNTGTVVVGHVGNDLHFEYLAVGDAVNLAARLQSAAAPGHVLISESTYRFVAHAFELKDLGEISVKGKARAVRVFQVDAPKAAPLSPRGLKGMSSPLVGREAELSALQAAVAGLAAGSGALVTVIGEPGQGKSRLISEWYKTIQSTDAVQWAEGHCLSYGSSLPYQLVIDLLRNILGEPAIAREVKEFCEKFLGESAREVYPYLAHLFSLQPDRADAERPGKLDPSVLQNQYLSALRQLLLGVAARAPLVLVLEDIHWADASSVEIFTKLLALIRDAPLLFCFVTRADTETSGWQLVAAARKNFRDKLTEIHVEPLTPAASEKLVLNLLEMESLPEAVQSLILPKTEGNPFFLEQVVQMLIDRDILRRAPNGRWVVSGDISTAEIPDSLKGLLLARIDRLPERGKRTLRVASVVGRQFPVTILERVLTSIANEYASELEMQLRALEFANLIHRAAMEPALEYMFRHALVQEAAYEAVLKADRRMLHRAVGDAVLALFRDRSDALAGTLAYHFEKGEVWAPAVEWLTRAADQASDSMALAEASDLYRRALHASSQLPPDAAREFHLRFRLGNCRMMRGEDASQTRAEFERALELAQNDTQRAEVYYRLGELFHIYTSSNLPAAEQYYSRALELTDEAEQTEFYGSVLAHLGYLYRYMGQPARSVETIERALAIARGSGTPQLEAEVLILLSGAYLDLNDMQKAVEAAEQGLRLAEQLGDLRLIGRGHSFLLDVCIERAKQGTGSPSDALPHIHEMLRQGREYGLSVLAGFGYSGLAEYSRMIGDRDAALRAAQTSVQVWRTAGAPRRAGFALIAEGGILLWRGEIERAEGIFQEARREFGSGDVMLREMYIGLAYCRAELMERGAALIEKAFSLAANPQDLALLEQIMQEDTETKKIANQPSIAAMRARFASPSNG